MLLKIREKTLRLSGSRLLTFRVLDLLDHPREICRIVLEIRIHHDHDVGASTLEPCRKRHGLAEVLAKPDAVHPRIALVKLLDDLPAIVGASVVDEDQLVRSFRPECRFHLLCKQRQAFGFVETWDHERHFGNLGFRFDGL